MRVAIKYEILDAARDRIFARGLENTWYRSLLRSMNMMAESSWLAAPSVTPLTLSS